MRESAFQKDVIWLLRKMGCICTKQTTRGMPDYAVDIPGGGHCYIEFKSSKGEMSRLQVKRAAKLRALGATVFCASPAEPVTVLRIMLMCARYDLRPMPAHVISYLIDNQCQIIGMSWGQFMQPLLGQLQEDGDSIPKKILRAGPRVALLYIFQEI